MSSNQLSGPQVLTGVLLGGLVIGAAAYFLSTKTGKKVRKDLNCKYQEIKEDLEDFISDLNSNISKNLDETTSEWSEQAKETVDYLKDKIATLGDPENQELRSKLMAGGGLLAAVLAVGTAVWLASHSDKLGSIQRSTSSSQVYAWKNTLKDMIDFMNERMQQSSNQLKNRAKAEVSSSGPLNEVLDFATAGLQLWQNIKKKG